MFLERRGLHGRAIGNVDERARPIHANQTFVIEHAALAFEPRADDRRRHPEHRWSSSGAGSDDRRHELEMSPHSFHDLFAQLGLDADLGSIQAFIGTHAPMPGELRLEDGVFWTSAQAGLLREALSVDADWADVVDRLNLALHTR
jgi:hypothetical protein